MCHVLFGLALALEQPGCGGEESQMAAQSAATPGSGAAAPGAGSGAGAQSPPQEPAPEADSAPPEGSSAKEPSQGPADEPGADAGLGAGAQDAGRMSGDAGSAQDPPEPVSCPVATLSAGEHTGSVQHQGRDRTYVLHLPQSYTGSEPVPVVFDFHGYGSSGAGQMRASGFRELGEAHGFATVYPDGVGGSWHVNGCCGQAAQQNLDEVGAVRAILADVSERVCVDPRRVYASGISQGGGMAHHVACLAADVFAAVAPVSSDLRTEPCEPARPIAQMSFRGTADALSAYEGGPVGPPGAQYQSIGAQATLERWRMIDQCSGTPEATLELCETYTQCAAGVEVALCSIPGGGHVLYDNPAEFDIASAAWAMFARNPQ